MEHSGIKQRMQGACRVSTADAQQVQAYNAPPQPGLMGDTHTAAAQCTHAMEHWLVVEPCRS